MKRYEILSTQGVENKSNLPSPVFFNDRAIFGNYVL